MPKKKVSPLESVRATSSESPENTQEYWNKVLTESGLSMNRGSSPRVRVNPDKPDSRRIQRTVYVGTSNNLVGIEEEEHRKKSGRVKPKGARPES